MSGVPWFPAPDADASPLPGYMRPAWVDMPDLDPDGTPDGWGPCDLGAPHWSRSTAVELGVFGFIAQDEYSPGPSVVVVWPPVFHTDEVDVFGVDDLAELEAVIARARVIMAELDGRATCKFPDGLSCEPDGSWAPVYDAEAAAVAAVAAGYQVTG